MIKLRELFQEQLFDTNKLSTIISQLEAAYKELDTFYGQLISNFDVDQQTNSADIPEDFPPISEYLNELDDLINKMKKLEDDLHTFFDK